MDGHGSPTFPTLHERDDSGRRIVPVPGALPTFHSFRHTAANHAIAAGEAAEGGAAPSAPGSSGDALLSSLDAGAQGPRTAD